MADPDLQIRGEGWGGGGDGHPDPDVGGPGLKNFFSALWASVWSKNKGETPAPRASPLDPPLQSPQAGAD